MVMVNRLHMHRAFWSYRLLKALCNTSQHSPIHMYIRTLVAEATMQVTTCLSRAITIHTNTHTPHIWKSHREKCGVQYLAHWCPTCRLQGPEIEPQTFQLVTEATWIIASGKQHTLRKSPLLAGVWVSPLGRVQLEMTEKESKGTLPTRRHK